MTQCNDTSMRYVVSTFKGETAVFDTAGKIHMVVARCGARTDAEMIATALNAALPGFLNSSQEESGG